MSDNCKHGVNVENPCLECDEKPKHYAQGPFAEPAGSVATSNYVVRERGDGVWCIYLRQYNVVVAEFSKGCASSVQEIKAILESGVPPNDQAMASPPLTPQETYHE